MVTSRTNNFDNVAVFLPQKSHQDFRSIPKVLIEKAVQSYSSSTLARSTEQSCRPIQTFLRQNIPESRLSSGIEARLRELRQSFSQRTELIKKRDFAVQEEKLESSEDETANLQTTTSAEGQLDVGYTAEEEKHSLWQNPPRSLHIRRPPCFIDISPHKGSFLKAEDARLYYIVIDDGGDLAPEPNGVEFLGISTDIPTTWRFVLPTWLPTPKEFASVTIEPNGIFYIVWIFFVMLAFIYNSVAIPIREAFDIYDKLEHQAMWVTCDSLADIIYLADLIIIKPRIQFIDQGVVMLPVMIEFFDRVDLRVSIGFAVRLAKTMVYLIYVIHVETCGYYAFNRFHGLNASDWSISKNSNNNNPYIYSFYVATKMATSIGNLPHATNPPEFIFMTVYWLTGVYVSAILIGQVIDILDSQSADKEAYKKRMGATLTYLKCIKAPEEDINTVRTWFNHNWNQQKTLDENMLIDALPLKLKRDVLIDVHYQTLSKVSLFKDCERTMILDLICKLKPVLFLPGALICEKNEETFILLIPSVIAGHGSGKQCDRMNDGCGQMYGEFTS
ncbi:unnamed protein product [Rodentolepis nana]|uniref:Ion transport domain-containing protein n=1 Tax=Rodentolepis nana TaxID=102285 RepID=A0A3P7VG13_RODNA|nr:unnamed protein product [Rodentolepis nana]